MAPEVVRSSAALVASQSSSPPAAPQTVVCYCVGTRLSHQLSGNSLVLVIHFITGPQIYRLLGQNTGVSA